MKLRKATSWLLLSEGYMYSAVTLSKECNALLVDLITQKNIALSVRLVPALFVAIYNARHGIELYLKSLIAIQCNSVGLPREYQNHELSKLLCCLIDGDHRLTPLRNMTTRLEGVDFPSGISQLESLVEKYEKYAFHNLPSIVSPQLFVRLDEKNMYFRYPDKEPTNAAILDQFESLVLSGASDYVEQNIKHLSCIQRLTEEIVCDMESLMKITQPIGNTIAAHISG